MQAIRATFKLDNILLQLGNIFGCKAEFYLL